MEVSVATTPTSPVTTRTLAPVPVNFAADWRVVSEKPGEVVLVNIKDGVTGGSQLRFAASILPDVFKGSDLESPSGDVQGVVPSKKGLSLLIQLSGSATAEEGHYTNVPRFPFSAHLVLRVPYGAFPETEDGSLVTIIQTLLGSLYETGETAMTSRIDALLHGALKPIDL